jgi:hypothetical protein
MLEKKAIGKGGSRDGLGETVSGGGGGSTRRRRNFYGNL